jgi:hypothetical protein
VDPKYLAAWAFRREVFFRWFGLALGLQGEVACVERQLWQLGVMRTHGETVHCFYRRSGPLTDLETQRLRAFAQVLLLHGLALPPEAGLPSVRCLCLLDLLRDEGGLGVVDRAALLSHGQQVVRFEASSGMVIGITWSTKPAL